MKESTLNKFIGAFDERDEYQKQEIYKELALSGIIFYYLSMLLMLVSLIIDTFNNEMSIITPILIILNIGYSGYIGYRLSKKKLDTSDCATPEEYERKKAELKRSCLMAGIQWGLWMIVMMEYILPFIGGERLSISWIGILAWSIGGIAFGVFLYLISKSKLQKQYDQE